MTVIITWHDNNLRWFLSHAVERVTFDATERVEHAVLDGSGSVAASSAVYPTRWVATLDEPLLILFGDRSASEADHGSIVETGWTPPVRSARRCRRCWSGAQTRRAAQRLTRSARATSSTRRIPVLHARCDPSGGGALPAFLRTNTGADTRAGGRQKKPLSCFRIVATRFAVVEELAFMIATMRTLCRLVRTVT